MEHEGHFKGETDRRQLQKIAFLVALLLVAAVSLFAVSPLLSKPETFSGTISYLDEKRTTVMELTAAATAASAAITLIPGDTATPIAEKLADMSTYFLVVICAIYLEKYLVTITGYAAFTYLIPAACLLFGVTLFWGSEGLKTLAKKLLVLGVALSLVIPAGAKVAQMIEATYSASIEQTMEAAKDATAEIEEEAPAEEQGLLAGVVSSLQNTVTNTTEKVESILNDFIEAVAVLIVTSCLIPILVLLFFLWLVKIVVGVDFQLPSRGRL